MRLRPGGTRGAALDRTSGASGSDARVAVGRCGAGDAGSRRVDQGQGGAAAGSK